MKLLFVMTGCVLAGCAAVPLRSDIPELIDNDRQTGVVMSAGDNSVVFTGSGEQVRSYKVYSYDSAGNDPTGWVLSGSDNGRKWKVLDRKSDVEFCSRFQEIQGVTQQPVNYRYYKLTFAADPGQEAIGLSEVSFHPENPEELWGDFIYPSDIEFEIDDPGSAGAEAYRRVVHDPVEYVKYHARKVAETLFYSAADTMNRVRKVNYILREFDGVAYKTGSGDEISIIFSTNHIKNSEARSLYQLDFETRGVLYHELVHGYQYEPKGCGSYGTNKEFWSFIEGVADAVRAHSGHFEMNTRRPGGNWLDGYRTTGFFIQWMTRDDPDAIRRFHKTALELDVWSWDSAIKALYGPDAGIESKWEEYQDWLKSPENQNQIIYDNYAQL